MERKIAQAKIATAAAGAVMLFASGVVGYGVVERSIEATLGGGLTGLAAAIMFTLAKVRAWTVDTSAERRRLEEAERRAHDTHTRYIAAHGAQMQEEARRVRDLEAERAALRTRAESERAQFLQELEDERAIIKVKSYLIGVDHGRRGILDPTSEQPGRVVQFPSPAVRDQASTHPADPAAEAVRDRGVARP
ncbi:hypothetical protein [Streptomyces lavendulae]|uniref:hypothetical protein n=1 Tax=Streptomyces lavendulae TaxID=1914 RepID=UPI0036EC4D82